MFEPHWVAPISYNSTTFQSIKSTGKLEFLPEEIRKEIINYYNKIGYYESIINDLNTQYRGNLYEFSQHYILGSGVEFEYLARAVSWANIDKKEFAIKFDALLTSRKLLWNYYYESLKKQEKRNESVMKLIKKELQANH